MPSDRSTAPAAKGARTRRNRTRFHPGGFAADREITVEFHRWHRDFLDEVAADAGFATEWHDPFISDEGLEQYGAAFFDNYLANPQSKLVEMRKRDR